jgi:rhodanese-related sulfurtransferase
MPATDFWRRLARRDAHDEVLPRSVDAARALDLVAGGAQLVDVRTDAEWRSGHAPGALHVPLGRVARSTGELRAGTPVVVVCHSGARSAVAVRSLRARGFDATSLRGGLGAWRRAGGHLVTGRNAT